MRAIPERESLEIEFKSDRQGYPDRELVEEIVGMANTAGGILFLGVEDDGTVTGVSQRHRDILGLSAHIANHTVPSVSVRAEIIACDQGEVVALEIPVSPIVVSTSSGKILRRRLKLDGSPEIVPLYSYEIPARLASLGRLDFSAQPLLGANLQDLDPNQRLRLRNIIQIQTGGDKALLGLEDDELDAALRLTVAVGDVRVPTVTGMLLLAKADRLATLMPTAKASFQVLEGTSVRLNEDSSQPLLEQLEKIETYLKAWNPERECDLGFLRLPVPEFDVASCREGIVNAFCHRDYTMLGTVRIALEDEGLSISSPGGFIDGVNLFNLLTVEPHGRNSALADALKRIGLVEKTGRGIDRIFAGSISYGRPWPTYDESTSSVVRLFIPRAPADLEFVKLLATERQNQKGSMSIYSLMTLSALYIAGPMTLDQIASQTRLSAFKLQPALAHLQAQGLVKRGSGQYFVFAYNGRAVSTRLTKRVPGKIRDSLIEAVVRMASTHRGIITKQDVVAELKLTPSKAYALLEKMQKTGRAQLLCAGKYAKYQIIATEDSPTNL